METYYDALVKGFTGTAQYTLKSILLEVPWYQNYFWGLVVISLLVWVLEIALPWRKNQAVFRKDFWLDGFYMFFNFFVFAIVIQGVYNMLAVGFGKIGLTAQSWAILVCSTETTEDHIPHLPTPEGQPHRKRRALGSAHRWPHHIPAACYPRS